MLTQRQIRRNTRDKLSGISRIVAEQNSLAAQSEIAAFMLRDIQSRMEGRSNG